MIHVRQETKSVASNVDTHLRSAIITSTSSYHMFKNIWVRNVTRKKISEAARMIIRITDSLARVDITAIGNNIEGRLGKPVILDVSWWYLIMPRWPMMLQTGILRLKSACMVIDNRPWHRAVSLLWSHGRNSLWRYWSRLLQPWSRTHSIPIPTWND